MAEYFAQLKLPFSDRTLLIVKISSQMVCCDHAIIVSTYVQFCSMHLSTFNSNAPVSQFSTVSLPHHIPQTASNSDLFVVRFICVYGISDKLLPQNQKQTLH